MEDTHEDAGNPRGSRSGCLPAMPALAENMTPEEIKKLVDEAVEQRLQEREHREGAGEEREGQRGSLL